MHKISIQDAKRRLRIHEVWRLYCLPGEPRKSCHCPFHEDRNASFSVSADGLLWKCFAGCGGGDAVDFLQHARGFSQADACREFLELAGGVFSTVTRLDRVPIAPRRSASIVEIGDATLGEESHWRELSALRNVTVEAVAQAVNRGLVKFGIHNIRSAWFVTDATCHNAQARRMDGLPWSEINAKAWTLRGSVASWPVGMDVATRFPNIAFCEGGPDLLAAFHFIHCEERETDCSAVAMLGAGLNIQPDVLPLFTGKRVRIFGHADASGAGGEAVERWAGQLTRAGASVDAFNFAGLRKMDGSPAKDLNDCTSVHPDDFEGNRELWRMMP